MNLSDSDLSQINSIDSETEDETKKNFLQEWKKTKQMQKIQETAIITALKEKREKIFAQEFNLKTLPMFQLTGLIITEFNTEKIKFQYNPSLIFPLKISKRKIFYCCLKYMKEFKKWKIAKEPMIRVVQLYRSAIKNNGPWLEDDIQEINLFISNSYLLLTDWAIRAVIFREMRYKDFKNGLLDYVEIDSEDEELYLTEDEIADIHEKRQQVQQRILDFNAKYL